MEEWWANYTLARYGEGALGTGALDAGAMAQTPLRAGALVPAASPSTPHRLPERSPVPQQQQHLLLSPAARLSGGVVARTTSEWAALSREAHLTTSGVPPSGNTKPGGR